MIDFSQKYKVIVPPGSFLTDLPLLWMSKGFPQPGISLFDRSFLGGNMDSVGTPEKQDGFVEPYFTENQELQYKLSTIYHNVNKPQEGYLSLVWTKFINKNLLMKAFLSLLVIFASISTPIPAHAGIFSFFEKVQANVPEVNTTENSQNTTLLQAVTNINPDPHKKDSDIYIVDDSAVETLSGPAGTRLEVNEHVDSDQISIYTVRSGDTLSQIAEMFGVSSNTIIWANNLKNAKDVKINDQLVILPISGVKYIVKKGDTIKTIATKFKGDAEEIIKFNDLPSTLALTVGQEIIIPDGEVVLPEAPKTKTTTVKTSKSFADTTGYFMRPVFGGVRTQGLHGGCRCGVDLANTFGTPVYAAAGGKVIISKTSGWNGGYGTYIVLMHPNGTQTLYAHLSQNMVSLGASIEKGQQIGAMGSSGRSTGSHLHFEVRGGRNPF